jgi:hypothetical protein
MIFNWAIVIHATFSFTAANENVYHYPERISNLQRSFSILVLKESVNSLTWIPFWNHRLLPQDNLRSVGNNGETFFRMFYFCSLL